MPHTDPPHEIPTRLSRPLMAVVLLLLGGCQWLGGRPLPQLLPEPGSYLQLEQALSVPVGSARVHIQDGAARAAETVDQFEPYCMLMSRRLSTASHPLEIQPDRFYIIDAWLDRHSVRIPGQLAAIGLDIFGDNGSRLSIATEFELRSSRQPDVYRLSCRYWADRNDPELRLYQIRATLGRVASLAP